MSANKQKDFHSSNSLFKSTLYKLFKNKNRSLFITILTFLSFLWLINPSNKLIALSFFVIIFAINAFVKNATISILFSFLLSLIIFTGKTYIVQLIPPGYFPIERWPFGYIVRIIISSKHLLASLMAFILLANIKKWKETKINAADIFLFLYFLWSIISSTIASKRPEISIPLTLLLYPSLIFYFYLRIYLRRLKHSNSMFGFIIAVISSLIIFESLISFQQLYKSSPVGNTLESQQGIEFFGSAPDEIQFRFRPVGTFTHANTLAQFLTLFLPLFFAMYAISSNFKFLSVFLLGSLTLIVTLSRTGWGAFAFSMTSLLYLLEKKWKVFIPNIIRSLIIPGLVLSVIFVPIFILPRLEKSIFSFTESGGGMSIRIQQIQNTLTLISLNPIFGVGKAMNVPEGFAMEPSGVMLHFPAPVHNAYLLTAVESGIPALIFLLLFIVYYLSRYINNLDSLKQQKKRLIIKSSLFLGIISYLLTGLIQPKLDLTFLVFMLVFLEYV